LRYQTLRLLRRKSELEIRGESGAVSIDGLVQTPGAHRIERSEICVKNHTLAAKFIDPVRDLLGS